MTSHPKDLSEELIDAMAQCEHVSNQLHLPVQSGSDRILRLMNREYTRAHYMDLVRSIREHIPDIGLSTDCLLYTSRFCAAAGPLGFFAPPVF